MLSKYSTEYSTLLNALGITGLLPNIPANILDADNDQINAMRIALASVKRTLHDRKTTERLITRLICGMLPPRGMRKAEPTSTRFYRGFFIVSDTRLTESDIHVKHQRVLRITGGKCLQTLVHYHYVLTVEYSIPPQAVLISRGHYSVTGIETSSYSCIRYIEAQLIEKPYDYSCRGFEHDMYDNETGNNATCGGAFSSHLPRADDLEVIITQDGNFNVDPSHSVWRMNYVSSMTRVGGYRGQYCIKTTVHNPDVDAECIAFVRNNKALATCRVLVISRV